MPLCPRAHGLFPLPQPVLATNTFCVQASSRAVQKKSPERGRVYRRRTGRGDSVQDSGSSEYHRSSHLCSSKHRSIAVSMNPCRTPFETPANRQPGKFAAAPNRVQTVHNDLDQSSNCNHQGHVLIDANCAITSSRSAVCCSAQSYSKPPAVIKTNTTLHFG